MKTLQSVFLNREAAKPLHVQLLEYIRSLIQTGSLVSGEALPSSRALATQLSISRNTVLIAYEQLMSEAYLETRPRAGVFVSNSLPKITPRTIIETDPTPPPASNVRTHTFWSPLPFWPNQPDASLFPLALWNRIRGQIIRKNGSKFLHYNEYSLMGLKQLRVNVAAHLRDTRGVKCDWTNIAITGGSQHGMFLLCHILLKGRKPLYIEDPGYNGIKRIGRMLDTELVGGQLDREGLLLPPKDISFSAIHLTPSRQFPTGVVLSLPRRMAFIDYAARTDTWIIEDDYDSDFRYRTLPFPSLQSMDTHGKVIYLGTFSKALFPSLRVGYIALPDALVDDFERVKFAADQHGPLLEHATLSEFIEQGGMHAHIRRCRKHYAIRQEAFLDSATRLGLPLDFRYTDGGVNLTGFLEQGMDDHACSTKLREAGIEIPSLTFYSMKPSLPGLVFGYTAFTPRQIHTTLRDVARILRA
jgi:GntR family transcriptional regulator/MocR family aminotransferase